MTMTSVTLSPNLEQQKVLNAGKIANIGVLSCSVLSDSLLNSHFSQYDYEDGFAVRLSLDEFKLAGISCSHLMAKVLDGFIDNPPSKVTGMMRFRNVLVRPLQLRTASLGCPVSSLLDKSCPHLFANQYPVLASEKTATQVQVLLGADDKHLRFRSCVRVEKLADGDDEFVIELSTRVKTNNWFGRLYMWLVNPVHTGYIEPTMLKYAVSHATESDLITASL